MDFVDVQQLMGGESFPGDEEGALKAEFLQQRQGKGVVINVAVVEGQEERFFGERFAGFDGGDQLLHLDHIVIGFEEFQLLPEKRNIQPLDLRIAGMLQIPGVVVHDNGTVHGVSGLSAIHSAIRRSMGSSMSTE